MAEVLANRNEKVKKKKVGVNIQSSVDPLQLMPNLNNTSLEETTDMEIPDTHRGHRSDWD